MCIMPRLSPAQGQVEASPEAIRTWERGHPTERRQGFVGIPTIYPCPHDRVMCSHVHIEGSVHMGACQLVLADARESRNHAENCTRPSEAPPLPCATFPKSPFTPRQRDRSSCSAGLLNRSRCGTGPISRRNTTDLGEVARHCLGSQLARSWLAAGSRLAAAGSQPRQTVLVDTEIGQTDSLQAQQPGFAVGAGSVAGQPTRPRPPPGGRER